MDPYLDTARTQADDRWTTGPARYLPAASVVVAAFAFMITTVVWRLVKQTAAVEAAVHEGIAGMDRFAAAGTDEFARLREGLAGQAAAARDLERRLATVEATGRAGVERLESLAAGLARQTTAAERLASDIERSSAALAQTRQEILERLAVDADRDATAREAIIREVGAAIGRVERTLLVQAEDLQTQKRQLDAAAERDRAARRVMLQEATQAFAVQVDGLRQLLDSLRVEARDAESATAEAALDVDGGSDTVKAAADLPAADAEEVGQGAGRDGEPATAAVGKETVLE